MKNRSAEVDQYIAAAPDFARPILKKLRRLFHQACPQIQETIKWGAPTFEHHGIVAAMSAFKQHVRFGFWKGNLLGEQADTFQVWGKTEMSGIRLISMSDIPPDEPMLALIRQAVELNEQGAKAAPERRKPAKKKTAARKQLVIPDYLTAALKKHARARKTFEAFSYSHQKEYVEWLTEAKQEATRQRRLATAIERLSEGKPRNWKYMKL